MAAARHALDDADKTLEGISGTEVVSQLARVESGQVDRFTPTNHVAFGLRARERIAPYVTASAPTPTGRELVLTGRRATTVQLRHDDR